MVRKWLGSRWATKKASASRPAPRTAPSRTSRTNPAPRESKVKPPTEIRLLYMDVFDLLRTRPGQGIVRDGRADAHALFDQIEGPPFYFGEDAANVFAEDAKRQQLNSGKKGNRNNQRSVAWNIDAKDDGADQIETRQCQRQQRCGQSDIAPHLERHCRKGHESIERQMRQFAIAEFGHAVDTRLDIERHADRSESDPGIKAFGKSRVLAHRAKRRDGPRVEEPEIPGALRKPRVSDRTKELIKTLRQNPPQRAIDGSIDALAEDILVALAPARDKGLDQLGGILQIGVQDDRRGPPCMIKARRYGDLLAEIPAQRKRANARVRVMGGAQIFERIVGRAIVDKNDFERRRATFKYRH